MTGESAFQETIRILIRRELGKEAIALERLEGGRNSRVFRIECRDGCFFAAKAYFQSPDDLRDRMGCEYHALAFMKEEGIREVPAPLCKDPDRKIAVYEFIPGEPLSGNSIGEGEIDQAVDFLSRLKKLASHDEARYFGPASEACFSIDQIERNVQARFDRLVKAASEKPSLASFLTNDLTPVRKEVMAWARGFCREKGLETDREIPLALRSLSPSDFGFHNALRRLSGGLVFLDFEYFGWDDPAKTVSDFLLHPGMKLTATLRQRFFEGMMGAFADLGGLADRVRAVYPLFGLKWCAILLNEFTREHNERRIFASESEDSLQEAIQLDKAKHMLGNISRDLHEFPFNA